MGRGSERCELQQRLASSPQLEIPNEQRPSAGASGQFNTLDFGLQQDGASA